MARRSFRRTRRWRRSTLVPRRPLRACPSGYGQIGRFTNKLEDSGAHGSFPVLVPLDKMTSNFTDAVTVPFR